MKYTVIWGLKARIEEPAETVTARERSGKCYVTAGYRGDRGNTTIKNCGKRCFLCGPHWSYIIGLRKEILDYEIPAPAKQGTPHHWHLAFPIPFVYDYITKLCRQQAEVIQNHDNENVCTIGHGEARHRKYRRLKLGGGQAYDRSSD
jgi:hypothetical protein